MPGMIVAPQPDAVEAGAHILANGAMRLTRLLPAQACSS